VRDPDGFKEVAPNTIGHSLLYHHPTPGGATVDKERVRYVIIVEKSDDVAMSSLKVPAAVSFHSGPGDAVKVRHTDDRVWLGTHRHNCSTAHALG